MASIRAGSTPVLLVVDLQVGVVAQAWNAQAVLQRVAALVERARADNVPVIWVQHADDDDLPRDSPAWQWAPPLQPAEGETRIHKRFNSSFEQTPLDQRLAELGAAHIVLAGAASNWCIRATAYGALERGYDLTLVSDAHTTGDLELGEGRRVKAEDIVADLNATMTWLSYPGRRNTTVKADALQFNAPSPATA